MGVYLVAHRYRAGSGPDVVAFDEGQIVELDAAVAEHVNRDSPGTLVAEDEASQPEPEPEPERELEVEVVAEPEPEQQAKKGGRRGS